MASIFRKFAHRLNPGPQGFAPQRLRIDWSHPLAKNLSVAFVLNGLDNVVNLAGSELSSYKSNTPANYFADSVPTAPLSGWTEELTPFGPGIKFGATDAANKLEFGNYQVITENEYTILVIANPAAAGGSITQCAFSQRGGGPQVDILFNSDIVNGNQSGGWSLFSVLGGAGGNGSADSLTGVDGGYHVYVGGVQGGVAYCFTDGVNTTNIFNSSITDAPYNASQLLAIGGLASFSATNDYVLNCTMPLVLVWNGRGLNDYEIATISADPFQIFIPDEPDLPALSGFASIVSLVAPLLGFAPVASFSAQKGPFRIRQTLQPATLSLGSIINPLTLVITCTTALSNTKTVGKLLSIASTTATTLAKSVGKRLSIASTTTTSAVRGVGKLLSIAATSTTSAIKSVGKLLSIAATTTTTVNTIKVKLVNIAITCTTSLSLIKQVGKQLAISATSALVAQKQVGKIISIVSTTATTAIAIKVKIVNIAITCTTAVTKSLSVGKQLAIASATAVTAARSIGKRLAIACTSGLSAIKSVSKTLAISCASTVTSLISRAYLLTLTIGVTTTTTARRAISLSRSIVATTATSVTRAIGKRLAIVATSAVSLIAGRLYQVTIAISVATSVTISAIKTFGANATAYARRIIGKATLAFIIGQPATTTIVGKATAPVTIVGTSLMTIHDIIDFICGDTWELTGPLQDANGVALDLTGASISWKLDTLDGSVNKLSLSLGSGITVIASSTATILVKVSATLTNTVAPGNYRDWLRVTLADGTVLTEWTGVIRVTGNPI